MTAADRLVYDAPFFQPDNVWCEETVENAKGGRVGSGPSKVAVVTKECPVSQRYGVIVKFIVSADSPEEAEEFVDSMGEKAAASFSLSEASYEGIEDIEEEEEVEEE
jgi:hypothetical protein